MTPKYGFPEGRPPFETACDLGNSLRLVRIKGIRPRASARGSAASQGLGPLRRRSGITPFGVPDPMIFTMPPGYRATHLEARIGFQRFRSLVQRRAYVSDGRESVAAPAFVTGAIPVLGALCSHMVLLSQFGRPFLGIRG